MPVREVLLLMVRAALVMIALLLAPWHTVKTTSSLGCFRGCGSEADQTTTIRELHDGTDEDAAPKGLAAAMALGSVVVDLRIPRRRFDLRWIGVASTWPTLLVALLLSSAAHSTGCGVEVVRHGAERGFFAAGAVAAVLAISSYVLPLTDRHRSELPRAQARRR